MPDKDVPSEERGATETVTLPTVPLTLDPQTLAVLKESSERLKTYKPRAYTVEEINDLFESL